MREALFIKKNKDRWERMVYMPSDNVDDLSDEFVQLVDDLGYAKTFYPTSTTTKFLNTEAAKRYLNIYRNRVESKNKIVQFFKFTLPQTVAKHHIVLLVCFLIFALFFAVGFYSALHDESIITDIFGPEYLAETEKNIADKNPFGIYQRDNQLLMFLGIMINNISVSFRYFFEGLLFPVFTVPELMRDGMMVGSFDAYFYSKGYGNMFILTVLLHGILELSAIVIATAAGVVLGKSWLFPKTLTRLQAFKQGARDGTIIMVGLIPVFILAAFFEGFITRYSRMPIVLSSSILIATSSLIIGYFIVYPLILKKRMKLMNMVTEYVNV